MRDEHIFGERLKQLRISKDMTQKDLANVLNVTKSTISNYERGPNVPTIEVLLSIAEYFRVSLDFLFGLDKVTKDNSDRSQVIFLPHNVSKDQYIFIQKFINDFLNYGNNNKTST